VTIGERRWKGVHVNKYSSSLEIYNIIV